jgi:hypothetical protein
MRVGEFIDAWYERVEARIDVDTRPDPHPNPSPGGRGAKARSVHPHIDSIKSVVIPAKAGIHLALASKSESQNGFPLARE